MNLRTLDLIVPPYARNILANVAKTTSFATIGGGYLRDHYYRVPHKDIDIFVNTDIDRNKLKAAFSEWTMKEIGEDDEDGEYDALGNFSIIELTKDGETPVQIMLSEDYTNVESVLDRFDFGFCQIAYNGTNVLVSEAFWKDAADNTATFVLKKDGKSVHPQSDKHAGRLKEKYPNVTWVWP